MGHLSHSAPTPPHKDLEMVVPDVLGSVHRNVRNILKTYSEYSFPDGSNDTNFSYLGLFWADQSSFEDTEIIREEHLGTKNWQEELG